MILQVLELGVSVLRFGSWGHEALIKLLHIPQTVNVSCTSSHPGPGRPSALHRRARSSASLARHMVALGLKKI